jgi:peptide/nickel transport system substrate-binding protein
MIFTEILSRTRDFLWNYPDYLFWGDDSYTSRGWIIYKQLRPFSHILTSIIVYILISLLILNKASAFLSADSDTFIEGTVVGLDERGNLKGLTRITPHIPSTIQLEKDIIELVYESLVTVDQDGNINLQLAESYTAVQPYNYYIFKLRKNVKWHDGSEFTADDVVGTFQLLKRLDTNKDTTSKYSNVVASQFADVKKIDDYTIELKLREKTAVMPTFFEAINFKILPGKYLRDLNENTILDSTPFLNRFPIGTGSFKFRTSNEDRIVLVRNNEYWRSSNNGNIEELIFEAYADEQTAVKALKGSKIHAVTGLSSDYLQQLSGKEKIQTLKSNVIYNRYWALYFNLNETGTNILLKDKNIREAIGLGINKNELLEAINELGRESTGPIPENSYVYRPGDFGMAEFDPQKAIKLLSSNGWKLETSVDENGSPYNVWTKNGTKIEFTLSYVDNTDRNKVAEVIKENLANVGIHIDLRKGSIRDISDAVILPKNFDLLLFGQETFIDPDRYELFHSSQIKFPEYGGDVSSSGLNISSYISEAKGTEIEEGELKKLPKVDQLLENGRSLTDRAKRREQYIEFQRILNEEKPVIFLYHPIYYYSVNQRVENINFKGLVNLEDRFDNVLDWKITV